MKRLLLLSVIVATALAFGACSSDDSTTAASITVNSASGSGVVLSGAWSRCFFEGPNDRQVVS